METQPEFKMITEPNNPPHVSPSHSQDITVQAQTHVQAHNKIKWLFLNHGDKAGWHLFLSVFASAEHVRLI